MILTYSLKARKQLKRLPQSDQKKVLKKIKLLVEQPYMAKKLSGELDGYYAIRAWPYRILYTIQSDIIVIQAVRHRQGAYR